MVELFYTHKKKVARRLTSGFWMIGLFDSHRISGRFCMVTEAESGLLGNFARLPSVTPGSQHLPLLLTTLNTCKTATPGATQLLVVGVYA